MRVLFIPSGDDKYGAPKSMMELVGNLKERHGIEPVIMTCSDGLINEWCKENDIECHVLGQGSFMVVGGSNPFRKIVKHSMYPYLRYKYKKEDGKAEQLIEELLAGQHYDLVHTNVNRIDIGGIYAKKHNIPHVWHLREFGKEDYNCMYLRGDAIQFMNESTDKFIAISGAVKKAWAEKGIEDKKIDVVYNGIDMSRFPIEMPERVHAQKDKIKIVFTGIISETKGQIYLIQAVKGLPQEVRNKIQVDFYGGGRDNYINSLKKLVEKEQLTDCISFKGYCSNVPEMLTDYDIGVVASRAEAFGRVTAEYMAAGLTVVASDTGANPEIIEDKKTGLIYPYGNPKALAKRISFLVERQDVLTKLREAAFEEVKKKYTMDICADNIYELYKRVLSED